MTSDQVSHIGSVSHTGSVLDPELLSRCISCGFCLPACPTYTLTSDETSSPRGRITLMRALESGTLPPDDPTLAEQASFCLGAGRASRCARWEYSTASSSSNGGVSSGPGAAGHWPSGS